MIKDYIDEISQQYSHIIVNGSPRSAIQCDLYKEIAKDRSFKILEILAPDEVCYSRLFNRTLVDKREDFSIDGAPGTPDPEKIQKKLSWWTADAEKIRARAKELGVYTSIDNSLEDELLRNISLKNKIVSMFF